MPLEKKKKKKGRGIYHGEGMGGDGGDAGVLERVHTGKASLEGDF